VVTERLPVAEGDAERRDVVVPDGERVRRDVGVVVREEEAVPVTLGDALQRALTEALRDGATERLGDALPDGDAVRAKQRVGVRDGNVELLRMALGWEGGSVCVGGAAVSARGKKSGGRVRAGSLTHCPSCCPAQRHSQRHSQRTWGLWRHWGSRGH
jgi:hypothetical protein